MGPPEEFPNAKAVIIFDIGLATTELKGLEFNRHTRIKVFDNSGVDEIKDVVIECYDYDKVFDTKALIHKADGRVVKFDKNDFEKIKKGAREVRRFTFPNLEDGDILEYSYSIDYYGGLEKLGPEKYFLFSQDRPYTFYKDRKRGVTISDKNLEKNISNIPSWFFDHPVYCLLSSFTARLGSELDYVYFWTNLPNDKIDPVVERIKFLTATIYKAHTWTIENVHPYPRDPANALPPETIRMGLHFQLFSTVNAQNRVIRGTYTEEHWQHVGEGFQGYLDEYVKTTKKMRNKARSLAKGGADTRARVESIFNFVVGNYRPDTNGFSLRPSHSNLKKVYKDRTGMPFEINILLVKMLNIAELKAWPVIISTRDKIDFRRSARFNHMLALVDIDGEMMFMDASAKDCPMGSLRPLTLADEGLLVDFDNSRTCDITAELCK